MRWRAVKAIFIKGAKAVIRSKEVWAWMIIFPVILLILTAYVFIPKKPPIPQLRVGIVNYDTPESKKAPITGELIVKILNTTKVGEKKLFRVKIYSSKDKMLEDLQKGSLDYGIVIPKGFSKNITWGQTYMEIYALGGEIYGEYTSALKYQVQGFLESLMKGIVEMKIRGLEESLKNEGVPSSEVKDIIEYAKGIAEPIIIHYKEVKPKHAETWYEIIGFTTISLIGMMLLFGGFISGSAAIVREKEEKTIIKLLSTPITASDILIGTTLSVLFEMLISGIVIVLFATLVLKAKIPFDITSPGHWMALGMIILAGLACIGIGLIISAFAKDTKGASVLGMILAWLFAFITPIWFPEWMLPRPLQLLGEIFPVSKSIVVARRLIMFGRPVSEYALVFVQLCVINIIVYLVGYFLCIRGLRRWLE